MKEEEVEQGCAYPLLFQGFLNPQLVVRRDVRRGGGGGGGGVVPALKKEVPEGGEQEGSNMAVSERGKACSSKGLVQPAVEVRMLLRHLQAEVTAQTHSSGE